MLNFFSLASSFPSAVFSFTTKRYGPANIRSPYSPSPSQGRMFSPSFSCSFLTSHRFWVMSNSFSSASPSAGDRITISQGVYPLTVSGREILSSAVSASAGKIKKSRQATHNPSSHARIRTAIFLSPLSVSDNRIIPKTNLSVKNSLLFRLCCDILPLAHEAF